MVEQVRAIDVLAAVGTVLAEGVPVPERGTAVPDPVAGIDAAIERALALLRTLPGVESVELDPTADAAVPQRAGALRLPLRTPHGALVVRGDPGPVGTTVLRSAADQIGGVLRAVAHVPEVVANGEDSRIGSLIIRRPATTGHHMR